MQEELDEIRLAIETGERNSAEIDEEIGDFLFATVNLARHLGGEPEASLRAANLKFQRRFKAMKLEIERSGKSIYSSSLDDLETAWKQVKLQEKQGN